MTNSRSRKNESNSSSESYTSTSDKCINEKPKKECKKEDKPKQTQNNKQLDDMINNINLKLNDCLKLQKKSEKKIDKKLCAIVDKIKQSKENKLNYEVIVKRLRKEKYLMVNGSDSYGMFYSYCPQLIEPNNKILFEKHSNILNLCVEDNSHCIKILRSGMYIVNLTCQFDQPGQLALFVNDNPELSSLTSFNNPQNFVTIHQILSLNKGDILSVRNYLSPYFLTTSISSNGIIPESKNICLNIWKISPEPEKCALPPKQNKDPWCYFESDSSSSDSDSSCDSGSSKHSKHSKHSKSSKSSECSYEESSELSPTCFINPSKYSN